VLYSHGTLTVRVRYASGLLNVMGAGFGKQDPFVLACLLPTKVLNARTPTAAGGGMSPSWGGEEGHPLHFDLAFLRRGATAATATARAPRGGGGGGGAVSAASLWPTALLLEVWNENALSSDDLIGSCVLPLPRTEVGLGAPVKVAVDTGGELELQLTVDDSEPDDADELQVRSPKYRLSAGGMLRV
jgi:hypothetical protein